MTIRNTILSATALSGLLLTANSAASLADGAQTFKPGQGITFEAGSKHAVGYFVSDAGRCKLVLTLAGEPNWDNVVGFSAIRHEATVAAGDSTRYANDGSSFEFGCGLRADVMTFKPLSTVASTQKE